MTEPRKPNTPSGPGAPSRPDKPGSAVKPGNVHDSHEPICATLHLDQRKLPATVFEHIAKMAGGKRQRMIDAEAAWENFGKPGRDPSTLGSVTALIANNGALDTVSENRAAAQSLGSGGRTGHRPAFAGHRAARRSHDHPCRFRGLGHPAHLPDSAAGTYHQGAPAGVGRPQDSGNRPPCRDISRLKDEEALNSLREPKSP